MLIEFSVSNFRSIHKQQTLSLVKAKGRELLDTNSFDVPAPNRMSLLCSATIYGPNAAGKSNLLRALRTMQRVVVDSASWQRGDKIPVTPFRLDAESESAPSEFEAVFIADGVRYQYGFSATEKRIHEEWLLAYPKGRAQRWFQRAWDAENKEYIWETGKSLQGEKQLWLRSTRENALLLSVAVQLNSWQLQPVYDWFSETLQLMNVEGWSPEHSVNLLGTKGKEQIINFLKAADLSIYDVSFKVETDKQFAPESIPAGLSHEQREAFLSYFTYMGEMDIPEIMTFHRRSDGIGIGFDLNNESDGTRKLFSFAGPWINTLEKGHILFIDELHDNLHPKLVRFLVNLFHSSKTNQNNAQLVFTTHETSILSQSVFRRDQIWFCEKDEDHATSLYPLTDFSPRKGRENLEAAYLSGRYGALPFIGDPAETA